MSFASEVREELCQSLPEKKCCRVAECYGILLYCNTFSKQEIRIVTENRHFAERLPRLFRRTFGVDFDQFPSLDQPGKHAFILDDREKLETIFSTFGQEHEAMALHINLAVLEDSCCKQSFLRGAFLSGGSVTDPDKRYHLELVTGHRKVSDEARSLLQELGFEPMDAQRAGSSILYLKQSDRIVDFLTMLGAPICAMKIIQAKMEKEVRNGVNRRVNCDTANLTKAVDAAQEQLAAIRILRETGEFERLPAKLQETARLREENPEATLSELAAMVDPPVSKPALSHRMRTLIQRSQ
jgi:hypothetical protein